MTQDNPLTFVTRTHRVYSNNNSCILITKEKERIKGKCETKVMIGHKLIKTKLTLD